jgi:hypothetical protein
MEKISSKGLVSLSEVQAALSAFFFSCVTLTAEPDSLHRCLRGECLFVTGYVSTATVSPDVLVVLKD